MHLLTAKQLNEYRQATFRLVPGHRLATKEEAIQFVNQRGFIFFWPIRDIVLPSLWVAAAGDRPVADEHDDPGHITWGWKDELLDKKVWYYARVLRKRNTIISLDTLPYFYALSPNYGDPENDYLDQYHQGLLTQESRLVYEALLKEGPLDTISLRKTARLSSPDSTGRFNKALDTLQVEFKILPVGIAQAGAWRYAFIYDLTHRHFPELIEISGSISESRAREHLIQSYLKSVGAIGERDIVKLFSWRPEDTQRAVTNLVKTGLILDDIEIENTKTRWLASPAIR